MAIAAPVLHSIGMGTCLSPNTSSILSAVERERFGVVAAFTTIAGMGFEPSLEAVHYGFEGDACQAFAGGLTRDYPAMAGLSLGSMCISAVSRVKTTGVFAGTDAAAEATQPGD